MISGNHHLLFLLLFCCTVMIVSHRTLGSSNNSTTIVHIGALINEENPQVSNYGLRNQLAMEIAIQYLNIQPSIQSLNISFQLHVKSTQSDATRAVREARDLFQNEDVIGIVGPLYSSESYDISLQVANQYKKPIISYGASSDILSNSTLHPYFIRVVPPNSAQAESLIDFLYVMEWTDISIINSRESYGIDAAQQLSRLAKLKQVNITGVVDFEDPTAELNQTLITLKVSGKKVFVCLIAEFTDIAQLLRIAHGLDMLESGYIWLFSETFQSGLYQKDSTHVGVFDEELLIDKKLNVIVYKKLGTSFWVKQNYLLDKWYKETGNYRLDQLNPFAFDAVLCFGYAVRDILLKHSGDIQNGILLKDTIMKQDFLGSSGRLKFSSTSKERIGTSFDVNNLIASDFDNSTSLRNSVIATWDYENSLEVTKDSILVLPGEVSVDLGKSQTILQSTISNIMQWRPLPKYNNPPTKRHSFSTAVMEKNDTMIIFGGGNAAQVFSDFYTFSFRENLWIQVVPISTRPSARKDPTSFILNDEYFVFGGFDDSILYNDFWKFSFNTMQWTQMSTVFQVRPNPRRTARSVVYQNKYAFMFGGQTIDGPQNDLWKYEYSSNTWTQVIPSSNSVPPGTRDHCLMIYNHTIILFGGRTDESPEGINSLWFFDIDTNEWKLQSQINAPSIRFSMNCAVLGNKMYVVQGWNDNENTCSNCNQYNDLYKLVISDTSGSKEQYWIKIFDNMEPYGCFGRDSGRAVSFDNYVIWFGGWAIADMLNDFWRFDTVTETLQEVHDSIFAPSAMARHTSVLMGNTALVFGGSNTKYVCTADLYAFDTDKEEWTIQTPTGGNIPRARCDHAAVAIADQMFIFGGRNNNDEYFGDIWVYSFVSQTWREIIPTGTTPRPRALHTAQIIDSGQYIFVYGGVNGLTLLHEIWMFNIEEESWEQLNNQNSTGEYPYANGLSSTIFKENKIMLSGGADSVLGPDPSVHIYDVSTNTFSTFSSLRYSETKHRATLDVVSDGSAFLFGGMYSFIGN
jgi:N-acetylneuraminic acid mutarotase